MKYTMNLSEIVKKLVDDVDVIVLMIPYECSKEIVKKSLFNSTMFDDSKIEYKTGRIIQNEFNLCFSISYDANIMFCSLSLLEHSIDVESKVLSQKHHKKIFDCIDQEVMLKNNISTRIIWCLKECLIKLNKLKIHDLISNKIIVSYLYVDSDKCKFIYQEKLYTGLYGEIDKANYAILFQGDNIGQYDIEFIEV